MPSNANKWQFLWQLWVNEHFQSGFAQEKLISIHKDAANLLLKPSAATVVVAALGLADRRRTVQQGGQG